MLTIGLCGGSGSGKGYVSSLFSDLGIPSIDTDKVYRDITSHKTECTRELKECFGDVIINPDGSLNRKELSRIVFFGDGCEERKKMLESITHRYILDEVRKILREYASSENRPSAVLVDAPLLFESGFDKECNAIIAVICDRETRIKRIISRDGITRDEAIARISSQISDEKLKSLADFLIINDGIRDLRRQVEAISNNILRRR